MPSYYENGLVAYYGPEAGSQVLPSHGVGDLEEEAWVGEFLGLLSIPHLLLAVPEPFVQLPLGEAGSPHELAEVALVPLAVVLLEGLNQDLELFVGLTALGFANQAFLFAYELLVSLLDLLGLLVDLASGDEAAPLVERGLAVLVASQGGIALLAASPGALLKALVAGQSQALSLSGLGEK